MIDQPRTKSIPVNAVPFTHPLPGLAAQLSSGSHSIRIVAIGSSSTAGEGGILPYPYWTETHLRNPWWLEESLRNRFTGRMIDVLNRGKGGEEAPAQLARFPTDVLPEEPCLVVWQVGANAVLKGLDLDSVAGDIARGLKVLGDAGIDAVLMDPQYAPPLLAPENAARTTKMLSLITEVAAQAEVDVFQRFAMMHAWEQVEKVSVDRMINSSDAERLHHSDWSTQRVGWELANAIAKASAL
jgi:hypothetical protein